MSYQGSGARAAWNGPEPLTDATRQAYQVAQLVRTVEAAARAAGFDGDVLAIDVPRVGSESRQWASIALFADLPAWTHRFGELTRRLCDAAVSVSSTPRPAPALPASVALDRARRQGVRK